MSHEAHKRGCCAISGELVWETEMRGGKVFLKTPLPEARSVGIVLTNGTTATLTVHKDHVSEVDKQFPIIWKRVILGFAEDLLLKPEEDRAALIPSILAAWENPPIGVLSVQKTTELH